MMSITKEIRCVPFGLQWSVKNRDMTRQLRWGFSVSLEQYDHLATAGRSLVRVFLQAEIHGECQQVLDTHLFGNYGYWEACFQAKAFIRNNVKPLIPELIANLFLPPDDVNTRAVNATFSPRTAICLQ
jgi:hypothetical protein